MGGVVIVIALYQTRPGAGDEVAAVLEQHVTATRSEPGCLDFVALRDAEDSERFALYERYVDEVAFQAHRRTPHFHTFVERRIVPLLQERVWRRYDELPAAAFGEAPSLPQ